MEYNENKFKHQLKKRQIEPSAYLWDKLEGQLDKEDTESKRKFWWLGIASSFLIGVFLMFSYNNFEKNDNATPIAQTISPVSLKTTPNSVKKDASLTFTAKEITKQKVDFKNELPTKTKEYASTSSLIKVVNSQKETAVKEISPISFAKNGTIETLSQSPLNRIVVDKKVMAKASLSEVEQLLQSANKSIEYMEIINAHKNTVNPNILLREIQLENSPTLNDFSSKTTQETKKNNKIVADK